MKCSSESASLNGAGAAFLSTSYAIGNANDWFTIDGVSGEIHTQTGLDSVNITHIQLTKMAVDRDGHTCSMTVDVEIAQSNMATFACPRLQVLLVISFCE